MLRVVGVEGVGMLLNGIWVVVGGGGTLSGFASRMRLGLYDLYELGALDGACACEVRDATLEVVKGALKLRVEGGALRDHALELLEGGDRLRELLAVGVALFERWVVEACLRATRKGARA